MRSISLLPSLTVGIALLSYSHVVEASSSSSSSSATVVDHPHHLVHRRQQELCSCSPQSYTFQLLLDNDCSTSTLSRKTDGISNANCQISSEDVVVDDGLARDDWANDNNNRYRRNRHLHRLDVSNALDSIAGYDDDDNNRYDTLLLSQLQSTLPTLSSSQHLLFNNEDRQSTSTTLTSPAYISSILFIEFDTSGLLTIINEDDTYLTNANLSNGTSITYPSISTQLNTNIPLEEQLDKVPGGAGLFLFANNDNEELVLRSRVVWEYDLNCNVELNMVGESLGWIGFEKITPAQREFCPTSPISTSSPTISPVTNPPTFKPTTSPTVTSSPTLSPSNSPVTLSPSNKPSASPTTEEPTNSPSDSPVTPSPTVSPSARPTITTKITMNPSVSPTSKSPVSDSPTSNSPTTNQPITLEPTIVNVVDTLEPTPIIVVTDSPVAEAGETSSPTTGVVDTLAPTAIPQRTTTSPTQADGGGALFGKSSKAATGKSSKAQSTTTKASKMFKSSSSSPATTNPKAEKISSNANGAVFSKSSKGASKSKKTSKATAAKATKTTTRFRLFHNAGLVNDDEEERITDTSTR